MRARCRRTASTARAPIELKVDYKKLNSFFADYTKNISKGGTFIKTKKTLPVGTRFLFRLTVPGRATPFELNGEVVHATASGEEPGMGIRFVWAEPRDRGRVRGRSSRRSWRRASGRSLAQQAAAEGARS